MTQSPYPKPSEIGGVLIRKVIALFKEREFPLPIQQDVFISVSGGADSVVLAHLIATYGRNIVSPQNITLLHLDHGWREESGTTERKLVETLATQLGVKFLHQALPKPSERVSRNLEEDARLKRQEAYAQLTQNNSAFILTAHHENDAVESIFWRFLRGEFEAYREGILFQDSNCLRPFLKVTKEEILNYAKSENVSYLEDPTNLDPTLFRGWMRTKVFPLLETQFPEIKKVLARYLTPEGSVPIEPMQGLILAVQTVTGASLNRAQRKALHELSLNLKPGAKLSLPGSMQIRRVSEGFLIENLDDSHP